MNEQMLAKRVFILGIDGVGTANGLVPTPNMERVFSRGFYTGGANACVPTISAECWGAILTGVLPDKHGLTNARVSSFSYPVDSAYPTVFRRVHEAFPGKKLAAFSNWEPINTGIIEGNLGCHLETGGDEELPHAIAKYLRENDPALLFLQLDNCDGAGHSFGYFTQQHLASVQRADEYIGQILDAIEYNGMWEDSLIILTTDHGGGGAEPANHGSAHPQDKTVFWGCCGPGVVQGAVLETVVSIADTAAICLHALGVKPKENLDGVVPAGLFAKG